MSEEDDRVTKEVAARNEVEEEGKLKNKQRMLKDGEINLKNKFLYCLMINHFCFDEINSGIAGIGLTIMIPLHVQELRLADDEIGRFSFLFVSLLLLGELATGLLISCVNSLAKPSYFRLLLRMVLAAGFLASTLNNTLLLLTCRTVIGLCIGYLKPVNMSEAYKCASPSRKGMIGACSSAYITIGITLGTIVCSFPNNGVFEWRVVYYALGGLEALMIILSIIYVGVDHSFSNDLKVNKLQAARKQLTRIYEDEIVDIMIQEEQEALELTKHSKGVWTPFKIYYRELFYGLLLAISSGLSFTHNYSGYTIVLTVRNVKDLDEAGLASIFISIASGCELLVKILLVIYPKTVQYRKINLVLSSLALAFMWLASSYFYYYDQWFYLKPLVILYFVNFSFIFTAYYSFLGDVLNEDIMGFTYSMTRIFDLASQYLFTYVFPQENAIEVYWIMALMFAIVTFICTLAYQLILFESYGLTKLQIHQLIKRKWNKTPRKIVEKEASFLEE